MLSRVSSQQQQLELALHDNGWRITERSTDLPWWAAELWTVESTWRPLGLEVFIAFTVCHLTYSCVDAVECLSEHPDRDHATIVSVSLTHWTQSQTELIEGMTRFRDANA